MSTIAMGSTGGFSPAGVNTSSFVTKPEPTEDILQIEQAARARELEAATAPATIPLPQVKVSRDSDCANPDDLSKLKQNINDSFSEIADLLLDQQRQLDLLLERIAKYNERSSHKI